MHSEYIEQRYGGYYVAGTRISLDSVVYSFNEGQSPRRDVADDTRGRHLVPRRCPEVAQRQEVHHGMKLRPRASALCRPLLGLLHRNLVHVRQRPGPRRPFNRLHGDVLYLLLGFVQLLLQIL